MKSILLSALAAAAVAILMAAAGISAAEKKAVTVEPQWKGSVEDESLAKDAPQFLATAADLEKLWKHWKLADKPPEVDFAKNFLIVATTRGGQLRLSAKLDEEAGDLELVALATRDLRPGFRYAIGSVSRAGVKTVAGKELPAP